MLMNMIFFFAAKTTQRTPASQRTTTLATPTKTKATCTDLSPITSAEETTGNRVKRAWVRSPGLTLFFLLLYFK